MPHEIAPLKPIRVNEHQVSNSIAGKCMCHNTSDAAGTDEGAGRAPRAPRAKKKDDD